MKVLYGVQGTGNGHLSRAMSMAEALRDFPDVEIDWLISGRSDGKRYPGIPAYQWRNGLTLVTDQGRVNIRQTFKANKFMQFFRDVRKMDFSSYDMIISDYEPVISHAARKQGIPVTGISHQCAFDFAIPMDKSSRLQLGLMRRFAPVTRPVALHWHHFGFPILPPMIHRDIFEMKPEKIEGKILVYLPMENPEKIIKVLQKIPRLDFYFYHPQLENAQTGNVRTRKISIEGFREDLRTASAIISNSGFELISEALHLGKSILAKPLYGQMEQLSNAKALKVLGYATIAADISTEAIESWSQQESLPPAVKFPDVPKRLARWINDGCIESTETLSAQLWQAQTEQKPSVSQPELPDSVFQGL